MTLLRPAVHVVVVCESPLAFLPLGAGSIVSTAVARAREAECRPTVSVWVAESVVRAWQLAPKQLHPNCEVVVGSSLFDHARSRGEEVLLVHDAQRPLTLSSTFDRVAAAIINGAVAARPAHVVVDTLKRMGADGKVLGTVDRNTVQSLTSPEGFLRSALIAGVPPAHWSLGFAPGDTKLVAGDQESLRVREAADVLLVESFLVWQTRGK